MKPVSKEDILFVGAKRTPFGGFGGTLKDFTATDLAVSASKAALQQSGVNVADVEHVVYGNVLQTSADAIYLARHVGLHVCGVFGFFWKVLPITTCNFFSTKSYRLKLSLMEAPKRVHLRLHHWQFI